MLKWTLKDLIKLSVTCAVVMLLAYARVTFRLVQEWPKRMIFCGMSVFFVLMGMLELFLVWRHLGQYSDEQVQQIDRLITGHPVEFHFHAPGSRAEKVHAQFERLAKVLENCTTDTSAERDEVMTFISDISHQAKTPIANIKIYAGILADRKPTPEQRQIFLSTIESQAGKLEFLLESLVKMSQLETGVIQIQMEEAPLCTTLTDALYAILPKAEAKGIQVTLNCNDTLVVRHDPKWTAEAVFNLLDNAVKYTPSGGSVSVRVQRRKRTIAIAVVDTGVGIAPDQQEAVFNRFYRTTDIQGEEGVGLGLFLTRKIIAQQGGTVQLHSHPGRGSAFTIFLRKDSPAG